MLKHLSYISNPCETVWVIGRADSAEGDLRLAWTSREETRRQCEDEVDSQSFLHTESEESYRAQNSLELKLPSRSSPPFYAKPRALSPKEKNGHWVDYARLPPGPSLWLISKIPCPSCLRDNYSEQPCRRTGSLKTVAFHIHAYIDFLFLGKGSSSLIWLLPHLASLKVICKVRGLILFLNLSFSNCLTSQSPC